VLNEVCSRFSADQGYGRICVSLPTDLALIRADKQALHSVLYHLLDNALKYAPDGEIFLNAEEMGANVDILVIDAGPGIPEDEREHVFEMFYRLDTSDARRVYGRGLGLHLAHRFLGAMAGGIALQTSDSGGTKVRIWLPKAQEDAC
jgi:K+-sensing histidine kinase KdpD